MSVYFPRLISEGNLCWNAWSLPAILTGAKRKDLLRSGGDGDCCNNFLNSFRCIVLDFIWTPREWDSVTVFTSVPCGDPIVFLTVVTVSSEVRVPMNTEKITRPIRNQIMANNFPGMDFGQRSPYLGKKTVFIDCSCGTPKKLSTRWFWWRFKEANNWKGTDLFYCQEPISLGKRSALSQDYKLNLALILHVNA